MEIEQMVSGMSIHLYTTTWLLLDRYCVEFYKIGGSFFLPQSEEIEVSLNLDKE